MSWQEYSIGLIDALALPGVVLILGVLFFRPLRAISRRVQDDLAAGKALQIGAGGVIVGITERDDYQAQWYKPYQLRLIESVGRATKPTEAPPAVTEHAAARTGPLSADEVATGSDEPSRPSPRTPARRPPNRTTRHPTPRTTDPT